MITYIDKKEIFRLIEIENKFHNVMFKSTEPSKRLLCKKNKANGALRRL